MRKAGLIVSGIVAAAMLSAMMSNEASVQPIQHGQPVAIANYPCGYDGFVNGSNYQPLYTHCGRGDVEIKADHFFWQAT